MNLRKMSAAALLAGMLLCGRADAWNLLPAIAVPKTFSGLPLDVSVDDFNNDGRKDVLMTMDWGATNATYAGTVMLFTQQASGKLAGPYVAYRGTMTNARAVDHKATDLNHDGRMDLVVANPFGITTMIAQPAGGFARAGYAIPDVLYWQNSGGNRLVLYDVDGDGVRDIVLFAWNDYAASFLMNANGTVRAVHQFRVPTNGFNGFAVGDVDHDGKPDVVSSSMGGLEEQLVVYGPDGQGGLAARAAWHIGALGADSVAIGDFDHDGLQEILFVIGINAPAYVGHMLLDPDLNIAAFEWLEATDVPAGVVAGDINGDGLDDAALYHNGWDQMGVFLQSAGRLLPENTFVADSNTAEPGALAIGDVNNDGCPDLVLGDYKGYYLLQVRYGTACNVSPLPTVDYGMSLQALPVKLASYDVPGVYQRSFTATFHMYSGDELQVRQPVVYIRVTALPGYVVKIAGTYSPWGDCPVVESTATSALIKCSGMLLATQKWSPKMEFSVSLDSTIDTQVRIDSWVESGSEVRREIRDTNPRDQRVSKTVSFVAQPAPAPCVRDTKVHTCRPPALPSNFVPPPSTTGRQ